MGDIPAPSNRRITAKSTGGAKLTELICEARNELINNNDTKYIVILAGICDLTTRVRSHGIKCLEYHSREAILGKIKQDITQLYSEFPGKVNIATIYPASIRNYYLHHNGIEPNCEDQTHQDTLNQDITDINDTIINCNIRTAIETIDLHRVFHSSSKKKKSKKRVIKFEHKLLPDGVHPADTAQDKCFNRIHSVLRSEIPRHILKETFSSGANAQNAELTTESKVSEDDRDSRRKRVRTK